MTSRDLQRRLDTYGSRKESLKIRINHSDWRPTPYISFTTSPMAAQKIANMRRLSRGPHTLIVVDSNARLKKWLPILDIAAEMKYYGIEDPYHKGGEYYTDHYACLWQVSEEEIVGEWQWNDLATQKDWYEGIIVPAFRQHRVKMVRNGLVKEPFNLSSLASVLPGTKCFRILFSV